MENQSSIEKIILDKDIPSGVLLSKYMRGSKKVTYDHIVQACRKERFARYLNQACFGSKKLIPLMIIPVLMYMLFWEE